MNRKTVVPLAASGALALLAAVAATKLSRPGPGDSGPKVELAPAIVAAHDLPAGRQLAQEDLATIQVEAKAIRERLFADGAPLVGRVTYNAIPAGATVTEASLAPAGTLAGLEGMIPAGMRAMSLNYDEVTGVGGMLEPGNRVDVVARYPKDADVPELGTVSKLVAQQVKVLAVGPRTSRTTEADKPIIEGDAAAPVQTPKSITLLLTPEQAERIDAASSAGQMRFALRAGADLADAQTTGASLADLRDGRSGSAETGNPIQTVAHPTTPASSDDPFANATPAVPQRQLTMIRGGRVSTLTVDDAPAKPAPSAPAKAKSFVQDLITSITQD